MMRVNGKEPRELTPAEALEVRTELEAMGFEHRPGLGDWICTGGIMPDEPDNDARPRGPLQSTDALAFDVKIRPAYWIWDGRTDVIHAVAKPPAHVLSIPVDFK